jgi:integrase/recombinase XerD
MRVQKVRLPGKTHPAFIVIGEDFLPIRPIQQFLDHIENVEKSPNTIRSYANHLKLFWEYLKDVGLDWTAVGFHEFGEFVAWLRNPQSAGVESIGKKTPARKESTVNAIITAVSMLYNYHYRRGEVKDIPLYRFQNPAFKTYKSFLHGIVKSQPAKSHTLTLAVPTRIPKILTRDQVQSLMNACHHLRDRFLAYLMYETGMRIGQVLGLRHADIRYWEDTVYVIPRTDNENQARAKTKESYGIPTDKSVMRLYTDYLSLEYGDYNSDHVFINLWEDPLGAPMTYGSVITLFHRLSKKTGFHATPHMLRHSYATEKIKRGVPIAVVSKLLGHSSTLTTSKLYSHLTIDDLRTHLDKQEAAS